jgi:hypothetical protein
VKKNIMAAELHPMRVSVTGRLTTDPSMELRACK